MRIQNLRNFILVFGSILSFAVAANAQFNSGSTGVDGALDLATMSCPGSLCEVQLPESGILNYTTVNVPSGKTLIFKRNQRNTPVIMLAQGDVNINGTIDVSAGLNPPPNVYSPSFPGPGGFYGGSPNHSGFGPGGGIPNGSCDEAHGRWVGPLSLVPIVGGSGAAGNPPCWVGSTGGGGGGAITIASSTTITVAVGGAILSDGRGAGSVNARGSGGAIRFVANSVNVGGQLRASNPDRFCFATEPGCGVIRLESGQLTFTGGSIPAPVLSPINPTIISGSQPQLTIVSIGGYAVPSSSGSRFDAMDLLLPNQVPDPINVVISATNIPTGTQVNVGFVSGSTNGTSTACSLTGSLASSTCTATISNLTRTAITYLLATAVFTPPGSLAKYNPKGRNQVAKVRLEAGLGAKPRYVFLGKNNKVIETGKIKREFLQYFGM